MKILGVQPTTIVGPPISNHQLDAMVKSDAILHFVQLNSLVYTESPEDPLPADIQELIEQYSELFQLIPRLPPKREGDHSIPLLSGAAPFGLRPYRYNPSHKDDEIEKQIKEMLEKGLIRHSVSPFSSPVLLVKKTGDW